MEVLKKEEKSSAVCDSKTGLRPSEAKGPKKGKPQYRMGRDKKDALRVPSQAQESSKKMEGALGGLNLKLSTSLRKKLIEKAALEGLSVDAFAAELISEGLVLRAWEIMEKKTAMKTNMGNSNFARQPRYTPKSNGNYRKYNYSNSSPKQNSDSGNHSVNGNVQGQGHRNYAQNNSYTQLMEDSASFLEYVRNQERHQR